MTLTEDDRDEIMGICIRRENMVKEQKFLKQGENLAFYIACLFCSLAFMMLGIVIGKVL